MTSNALKIWQALLVALTFITGASEFGGLLPAHTAVWCVLVVGALAAGTGYYTAHVGTMPADRPAYA